MDQAIKKRVLSISLFIVGVGLSGISFYLAARDIPLNSFGQVFRQADWVFVVLVFFSIALNISAKAARWRVLLGQGGLKLPFFQVLLSIMSGQLWNQVYPVRVGDLSRAWLPGFNGEKKMFILSTVALEKLLDTVFYAFFVFVLVFWAPVPAWLNAPVGLLAVAGAGLLVVTLYMAYQGRLQPADFVKYLNWLPQALRSRLLGALQAVVDSLAVLRANFMVVFGWTMLIWLTAVLNIVFAMLAMHISVFQPPQMLFAPILLLVTLQAGISLPSAPLTIGVFEYICKTVLQFFGQDGLNSFVFAVFLHFATMLPLFILGPFGSLLTWYKAATK